MTQRVRNERTGAVKKIWSMEIRRDKEAKMLRLSEKNYLKKMFENLAC